MAQRGVNKVILLGNLGKDPEIKYMPNGNAVANITLATTETWNDKSSGEKKEKTEWHRIVFFGKLAEIVGQYLKKGSKIYIEGKLQTRKWQGQDGQDRYTTEIVAEQMQMLGSRSGGTANFNDSQPDQSATPTKPEQYSQPQQNSAPVQDDFDDDIPF